jgi:hypothetical protein
MQSTLDGTQATPPREVWLAPITKDKPGNLYGDAYQTLEGYADGDGRPVFAAMIRSRLDDSNTKSPVALFEAGRQTPICDLPYTSAPKYGDNPRLLVDAKGRRHLIALFTAGESPAVRDYLVGSDDEPAVVRAIKGVGGYVEGFQAFQGPGGRMVVLTQMKDGVEGAAPETYLSTSDGGAWSAPVNVTNNAGRTAFVLKPTGRFTDVARTDSYKPGACAAAFAPDGHLVLAMVVTQSTLISTNAVGIQTGGAQRDVPTLVFLRF